MNTVRFFLVVTSFAVCACQSQQHSHPAEGEVQTVSNTLSMDALKDKIMGGWAGQTIGVTFGGPTEFRFNGTYIQDYQPIKWYDGYIKETMQNNPGLYDDIYMDLTFVEIFEKHGLDAPVEHFAKAYAEADYMLWHANQAGRYNILHGISAPASGHWLNNPHADCIDFQIESDFAGLMSPGMPNTAAVISDSIGHIMNYGDGWYGGVYVSAMYALAFVSNDVKYVVTEGLKMIPSESRFYQVINDVIGWHRQYPDNWKKTWFEIQQKYSEDIGCPDGVFAAFNIDATVNAAYVVLGLLYGDGDFTKTLEISTRAGQDSDCNPSTAGGILGTLIGYKNIPDYWKAGLAEAESLPFKYTNVSLNDVYAMGLRHAIANVERNGGTVDGNAITLKVQEPKPVRFEQSFTGHYPVGKTDIHKDLESSYEFEFDGIGFVVRGSVHSSEADSDYRALVNLYLDGQLVEEADLPADFTTRRYELFWKYKLSDGRHKVRIQYMNPQKGSGVRLQDVIVYGKHSDRPS